MGIFKKSEKPNEKSYEEAKAKEDQDRERRPGETTQAYNERVPVAFQPLAPRVKLDYIGRPLK
jgi:hypothetical protein